MSTQHVARAEIPADTFELRLAIARFHAGLRTAKEAGFRVGVSGQTWINWEAGTSPGAKAPSMLHYIANQLGVDEDWLRDGGELGQNPRPSAPPTSGVAGQYRDRPRHLAIAV